MSSESSAPSAAVPEFSPYHRVEARAHAMQLGMWIFLGSETLLFAGLFALFVGYRVQYALAFAQGVAHNQEWIGSVNTFVLLSSSFCVAWAVHAMRSGGRASTLLSLATAMLLGSAFLGLKALEYAGHFEHGIVPGAHYRFTGIQAPGARLFFTLYYLMTGLHALHVIAGLAVLAWLVVRVWWGSTTREHHSELELGGLYWHLVDIVWIFLWPLLYLIR